MLAASARRAGYVPLVVDSFADADLATHAHAAECLPKAFLEGFHRKSLTAALDRLVAAAPSPPVGLVLGAGFEESPDLIGRLGERYGLLGCTAEAVRKAKDPAVLFPMLAEMGIRHPETRLERPADGAGWLTKRIGGSGGTHIRECSPSPRSGREGRGEGQQRMQGEGPRQAAAYVAAPHPDPLPVKDGDREKVRRYYQRRVEGMPVSVMAVMSPRGEAVAFTRQWVEPAPRMPFRYGGAAGHLTLPPDLEAELVSIALPLGRRLGLRGLVSFDFAVGAEGPLLVDVNPRPGATLDVLDDGAGTLFAAHVAACRGGSAADLLAREWRPRHRASAYLYADGGPLTIGAVVWPDWAADLPGTGTIIPRHAPVATVGAEGATPAEAEARCRNRLEALAEMLYGQSGPCSPAEHRD